MMGVQDEFPDTKYIEKAVELLLRKMAPSYNIPSDFFFQIHEVRQISENNSIYKIDVSIDFKALTNLSQDYTKENDGTLSAESLLIYLLDASLDLNLASERNAEIASFSANAALINFRIQEILKYQLDEKKISEPFQELIVRAPAIGAGINEGIISFKDLIPTLKAARSFKEENRSESPTNEAIEEYYKEITPPKWVDSLPVTIVRFSLFNVVPSILVPNPIVGIGVGAVDTFLIGSVLRSSLLTRLTQGWKPNQLVKKPQKKTIKQE